jgi:hypothetical protein
MAKLIENIDIHKIDIDVEALKNSKIFGGVIHGLLSNFRR